jgi:hypothetical protein
MFGRGFQVQTGAIGEQVIFGAPADRLRQAAAQFTLQKAHYSAHSLQRKTTPAQVSYDRHFRHIVERVQPVMSLPGGNDNSLLIPPLQLPGSDADKLNHLCGCEAFGHLPILLF